MNAHTPLSTAGLPRRKFTVADVERMVVAGIMAEDERVELIDGELIAMSPKGMLHEVVRQRFLRHCFAKGLPRYEIFSETTLRLSRRSYVEPDLLVLPLGVSVTTFKAEQILLAVEVADTSLDYDLNQKPAVYAAHGVRELWVIDVGARALHVHRRPEGGRYASVSRHGADELVAPSAAPDLALRLSDLDWED